MQAFQERRWRDLRLGRLSASALAIVACVGAAGLSTLVVRSLPPPGTLAAYGTPGAWRERAQTDAAPLTLAAAGTQTEARGTAEPGPYTPLPLRIAQEGTVAEGLPRVFVHYSTLTRDGGDEARRVRDYLRSRGFTVVEIRAVTFPITTPRVRYFFPEDERLARGLTSALAEYRLGLPLSRTPVRLQDYAHYRPLPARGNVEVWLPTDGGNAPL